MLPPSLAALARVQHRQQGYADPSFGRYSGLQDYPGLVMRSNQAYDDEADRIRENAERPGGDPFATMKLSDNLANKMNPWSPFYQAMSESAEAAGGPPDQLPRVRFSGYDPKRDAVRDAAFASSGLKDMPFAATAESYPMSVRRLFGDNGAAALTRGY